LRALPYPLDVWSTLTIGENKSADNDIVYFQINPVVETEVGMDIK
jgi:hypothetical protein